MSAQQRHFTDRILHWLSAITILFLLFDMGTRVHNIDYRIKGALQHKQDAIELHLTVAAILFIILIMRLIWARYFLHASQHRQYHNNRHRWLVRIVHTSMYITLFSMMVSGAVMVTNYEHAFSIFGVIELSMQDVDQRLFSSANDWHLTLESLMYFLIFVHFAGAIYNRK